MITQSTAEGFQSSMERRTSGRWAQTQTQSISEWSEALILKFVLGSAQSVRLCLGVSCRLMPTLSLNIAGSGSPVTSYWLLTCSIALYILRLMDFFLMLNSKSQRVLDICAEGNVSVYSDFQLCEWISSTKGNYGNTCALHWAPLKAPQSF